MTRTTASGYSMGHRRGAVLGAALVGLLVVMLISAALVRGLIFRHRQLRVDLQRQQAFWFAESAVQRALARSRASADYNGENWTVTMDFDGQPWTGRAEIHVQPAATDANQRQITVDARWSDPSGDPDGAHSVLEQRQLTIELPPAGASS